nr:hypothetical protein [Tanacetum cinerariifolium]
MDNYKWVLECLKLTLDESMLPRVIITDKDLALMNACKKVFPNATRLLCRWHISQNILKNCRQTIKVQHDWDSFLSAWKLLEDSPTWISYMENYKQLQLVLRKYPRVLSYVDDNWLNNHKEKTLDVSWSTPLEHEDIQFDDELHIFKETFNKQLNAGKKSLLRRLDINEEPARHSSYVSQSFAKHGSSTVTSDSERFLRHLPQIFHPYLTGLQDVRGDGNCGFRSVVVALGLSEDQWPRIRSDLVQELEANHQNYKYIFGTTGYTQLYKTVRFAGKWIEMPNTGLIIASAYNRVVISLANGGNVGGCTTTFLLLSSPPQSEPHETIVIAHVYGNHFIKAALREGCPLPMTHLLWRTYRSDIASRWEDPYVSRQEEFREHYYSIPEFFDLSK